MTKQSVTVIGVGLMGENHAHAISNHPTLELDSVVDIDADHANRIAEEYNANSALTDYEEALDSVDAAIIATPASAHIDPAIAAMERKIPLLLEKPIANNLEGARRIAQVAESTESTTAIGFLLRYDPAFALACEAATTGELGDIVGLRAMAGGTVEGAKRTGGRIHPIHRTNAHDIDLLQWCAQSTVEEVQANSEQQVLADRDIPDVTQALLEFENGTSAVLESHQILPEGERWLELIGTDGFTRVEKPGDELIIFTEECQRPDTRYYPVVNGIKDGAVRRQIDWFARTLNDEVEMLATIENEGMEAMVVGEAIIRATDRKGPVQVDSLLP